MDRTAIIHSPLGKASFPPESLLANMATLVDAVVRAKPAAVKGTFIRSAYMTCSMGPRHQPGLAESRGTPTGVAARNSTIPPGGKVRTDRQTKI